MINKIETLLNELPPEQQLRLLEKLAMKIRKQNSILIEKSRMAYKFLKIKEPSNNYK
jgi:hypothetical protein